MINNINKMADICNTCDSDFSKTNWGEIVCKECKLYKCYKLDCNNVCSTVYCEDHKAEQAQLDMETKKEYEEMP